MTRQRPLGRGTRRPGLVGLVTMTPHDPPRDVPRDPDAFPPVWAGETEFEIADEPPDPPARQVATSSRRYFTIAVAVVAAVGAVIGLLAS